MRACVCERGKQCSFSGRDNEEPRLCKKNMRSCNKKERCLM